MQQGGSQYGVSPETVTYTGSQGHMLDQLQQQKQVDAAAAAITAEAASPISSRPPIQANSDELATGAGRFADEDVLLVGEDAERGTTSGNRWPRQETLALLKIRSDMDAVFKEASLKWPLWEDVSRMLGELGYNRSAKKCKEKFENVHKYYKRTKEVRAGRQDTRNYRFSSELEAFNSSTNTAATTATTLAIPISVFMGASNPMVGSSPAVLTHQSPAATVAAATVSAPPSQRPADLVTSTIPAAAPGISFSSDTSSSSGSDDEKTHEEGINYMDIDTRKRKRNSQLGGGRGYCSKKMMAFFERLMKEVMQKQDEMLQRFTETIEKREQDRMIREEAWRRQEMARLNREQEIIAQERAISAARDAAVISFLHQITGQTVQIITQAPIPTVTVAPPPQPNPPPHPPPQLQPQQLLLQHHQQPPPPPPQQQHVQQQQSKVTETIHHHSAQSSELVLGQQEQPRTTTGISNNDLMTSPSRWPKAEVLALIKIKTRLENKYQESGPKGPLWEDISMGMQQLGYKRSAKKCKEKWENINKYFKKVKESNKKRPEDAKTCPYFHELDALYRSKLLRGDATALLIGTNQEQEISPNPTTNPQETHNVLAILPPVPELQTSTGIKTNNKNDENSGVGGSFQLIQTSGNGGLPRSFFEEESKKKKKKKPEDIMKELMSGDNDLHNRHHSQQQEAVMEDYNKLDDSDNLDDLDDEDDLDDDDDDDDGSDDNEEDKEMPAYKIQYQRPNPGPPSNAQGDRSGSFLAVVQ